MGTAPLSVSLELEQGYEPITGSLHAHGQQYEFRGWIELAALIDSLRGRPAERERSPWGAPGPQPRPDPQPRSDA